jgi:hypothetical protein
VNKVLARIIQENDWYYAFAAAIKPEIRPCLTSRPKRLSRDSPVGGS